jgi:hypothetical protein
MVGSTTPFLNDDGGRRTLADVRVVLEPNEHGAEENRVVVHTPFPR